MNSVPFFSSPCRGAVKEESESYEEWQVSYKSEELLQLTLLSWGAGILWRSVLQHTCPCWRQAHFQGQLSWICGDTCHVPCCPFHEQLHHLQCQSLHHSWWESGPSSIGRCPVHRLGPGGDAHKSEPSQWCVEGHEQWWLRIVKEYEQVGWGSI